MHPSKKAPIAAVVLLMFLAHSGVAQNPPEERVGNLIQGGHSGTWYHPEQPGHGLFVEVLHDNSSPTGKEVVAAWFAHFDGQPVWLLGQGDVIQDSEGFSTLLEVSVYTGNDFPPRFDPASVERMHWGELALRFTGCDKAHMSWSSDLDGYGSGELNLRRLSQLADSHCIPDLDGSEKDDDHGDDWANGTYLTGIGRDQLKLTANLESGGDVDVFVFTVQTSVEFKAYTFGTDDAATRGALYEIVGFEEVLVASADDDDPFSGFDIEEYLFPGTYSLHVSGKNEQVTGPYHLYYQAVWD